MGGFKLENSIISSCPILCKYFQESWTHEVILLRRGNESHCSSAISTEMAAPGKTRRWFRMSRTTQGTNWAFVTTSETAAKTQTEWNRMWNVWEMIQLAAENQPGGAFMMTDADHKSTWTQREITSFIRESMVARKSLTGKDPELKKT